MCLSEYELERATLKQQEYNCSLYKPKLTTFYNASKPQITYRTYAMNHKYQMVNLGHFSCRNKKKENIQCTNMYSRSEAQSLADVIHTCFMKPITYTWFRT